MAYRFVHSFAVLSWAARSVKYNFAIDPTSGSTANYHPRSCYPKGNRGGVHIIIKLRKVENIRGGDLEVIQDMQMRHVHAFHSSSTLSSLKFPSTLGSQVQFEDRVVLILEVYLTFLLNPHMLKHQPTMFTPHKSEPNGSFL